MISGVEASLGISMWEVFMVLWDKVVKESQAIFSPLLEISLVKMLVAG